MKLFASLRKGQTMSWGLLLAACVSGVGCTVDVGGQTLPSPYYLTDDIQYFAPGPEFKLTKEAAAIRQYAAEQQAQGQGPGQ